MSRTKYERDRIQKAAKFEQDFAGRVKVLRNALLREIRLYLENAIGTDQDNRVRLTVRNVRAANGVTAIINRFIRDKGAALIRWTVRRLSDLFRVNANYFRASQNVPESVEQRAFRLLMLRLGYDTAQNRVVQGGFLASVFQLDGVAASVARDIQQALAARMTLAKFRQNFSARFLAAGYMERWFDRFSRDLFHQFDAATQNVMSEELGLDYFQYSGTSIRTTRCFCDRRLNRIYTKDFAERWNNDSWRGKIENGNFFTDRGGYNCRHHLSYMTETRAKRVSNQRGFEINSFNETGCNE